MLHIAMLMKGFDKLVPHQAWYLEVVLVSGVAYLFEYHGFLKDVGVQSAGGGKISVCCARRAPSLVWWTEYVFA
jgi:hypothetical protein